MTCRITVLTPTLNAERWFPECLRSLDAQTIGRAGIQHLVLDGASTDRTIELARAAGAVVDVARDGSLYEALNRGVSLAEGEIIAWLNADDTYAPDALERVLRRFEDTDAELVIGDYAFQFPDRIEIVRTPPDALDRVRAGARRTTWVTPFATFFRAETLRSLGPYLSSYRIAADLDLWLRAAARTPPIRAAHTGSLIGYFRMHEASLSSGARIEPAIRETIQVARACAEDRSRPEGVRRHALYLARLNAMKLAREQSRGRTIRERLSALRAAYGDLAHGAPGALWDIRGEVYAFAGECFAPRRQRGS